MARLARRTLLVAALVFVLGAGTAGAAELTVTMPDGTQKTVVLDGKKPDVTNAQVGPQTVTGISLPEALAGQLDNVFGIKDLTLSADSESVTLNGEDVFNAKTSTPTAVLVVEDDGSVRLFTTQRQPLVASNGSLTMTATYRQDEDDSTLRIQISPANPRPGQAVTFSVADAPNGATFQWVFGRGEGGGKGATPEHTFRRAGTYRVGVVDPEDRSSGRAFVKVREPKEKKEKAPEPDTDDAAGGGSDGGGGWGTTDGGGGPGGGGDPWGGGDFDSGGDDFDSGGGAWGDDTGSPPDSDPLPPDNDPAPTPESTPTPAPTPEGPPMQRVSGELLSGEPTSEPPMSAETLAAEEAAATAPDKPQRRLHIPGGVWIAGGLLALVWFGWGADMRFSRPRWS